MGGRWALRVGRDRGPYSKGLGLRVLGSSRGMEVGVGPQRGSIEVSSPGL